MDEELFYRGEDSERRWLSAAHRAAESILRSYQYLKGAFVAELMALLHPSALWGLCLVLAGWFAATVIGGPVGLAVNLGLLAYGLWDLWGRMKDLYGLLKVWFWGFWDANTEADLDKAGEHFAQALSKGGITILELVLTHRAFRYAQSKLVSRFPVPERLRSRFDEQRRRMADAEEQSVRESERRRAIRPEDSKLVTRLQELRGVVTLHGGKELGRDLGDGGAGTALYVVLGLAATGGTVALVMAAAHAADQKRRVR